MAFFQQPPRLANQFDDDPMLVSWIARFCPEVAGELRTIGELSVEYHGKQLADRRNEPVLTQWDAWGHRIDRIEVSPTCRAIVSLCETSEPPMRSVIHCPLVHITAGSRLTRRGT